VHLRKHRGERPFVSSLECGANAVLLIESDSPQPTLYLAGFHQGVRPARARACLECGANAGLLIESDIPQLTLYLAGFHQVVRPARARAQTQREAPLRPKSGMWRKCHVNYM
jgi:hypothetical protein